ncbi:hypothetical protein L841_5211 [Mycobacterium sp. MAC_080597_8934]|nr:hypothetical protein L839_2480 [Mycobacterium avium MAV_120809_2495]ETZ49396.1 hypothetical protein L837_0150 [Mycobacterium avium MAV_061107_1842]ETZ58727.1 hypothetical protein L841_5211 [Mycobacterium sp. MAC_080597_8934]ETZ76058.1 hypothetical protein L840_0748 [Mycobacterium sp. MAC_011194_8550]
MVAAHPIVTFPRRRRAVVVRSPSKPVGRVRVWRPSDGVVEPGGTALTRGIGKAVAEPGFRRLCGHPE